ncbi:MAG: hypothetical protein Q8M03_07610 [Legionella sp.]|nr:hypothetical protein [Legionella sp.]
MVKLVDSESSARIEENFKKGEKIVNRIFEKHKNEILCSVSDKEEAYALIAKQELLFYAMRFELRASILHNQSEISQRDLMYEIARMLRAECANPSGHNKTMEEIIYAARMSAIPEKPVAPKSPNKNLLKPDYGAYIFSAGALLTSAALLILAVFLLPLGALVASVIGIWAIAAMVVGIGVMIKLRINERYAEKAFDQATDSYSKYINDLNAYENTVKATERIYKQDIQLLTDIRELVKWERSNNEYASDEDDNQPPFADDRKTGQNRGNASSGGMFSKTVPSVEEEEFLVRNFLDQ